MGLIYNNISWLSCDSHRCELNAAIIGEHWNDQGNVYANLSRGYLHINSSCPAHF